MPLKVELLMSIVFEEKEDLMISVGQNESPQRCKNEQL